MTNIDKEIELMKLQIQLIDKEIELEKLKRSSKPIPVSPYVGDPFPNIPYPYRTFTQPHSFSVCTAMGYAKRKTDDGCC